MAENKIKKAVLREDLLSITSDFREAIILNQFIYWSERISDADILIEKENEIAQKNGDEEREPFYGWIYKTTEELSKEVMLGLSASQIRKYINNLVDYGYIAKRNNPKYKWDRTLQYKVNLVNIARALKKKGYPLSDYRIDIPDDENTNAHKHAIDDSSEAELMETAKNPNARVRAIEYACMRNQIRIEENSNAHECIINGAYTHNRTRMGTRAIPETTTETTTEIFDRHKDAFEIFWKIYPRKKDMSNAAKKFNARINSGFSEEELIEAAKNYSDECNKNCTEEKYIKYATTFLGDDDNMPFVDYLDKNYIPPKIKVKKNSFNNVPQQDYDFNELEKLLLKRNRKQTQNIETSTSKKGE